jgi:D-serine deaminase-like pyridoxal phosphate-dependent protein
MSQDRSSEALLPDPSPARTSLLAGLSAVRGDIQLPAMLLKEAALRNNLELMADYAAHHEFLLAPHGKTTMAPQLFRRQLDAGAWGITVANMAQARVAYAAGAQRVLVANEVVSQADARAIANHLASNGQVAMNAPEPGRQFYCLVDSVKGVGLLDRHLGDEVVSERIGVFVELGVVGGRTGARSEDEAVAVAEAVARSARLRLVGVEGFEGVLGCDRSPETLAKVDEYLERLRRLAVRLAAAGAFPADEPVLVSAGGSLYFDRVAQVLGRQAEYRGHRVELVVRAGCYIVHDNGTYAAASPLAVPCGDGRSLRPALEVWAEVLSVPEPGLVIVGLGKRDVSYDLGYPVTLGILRANDGGVEPFAGATLSGLNDQHGYLRLEDGKGPVNVGDRIGFGISHPCTALDKWRTILLVNDDYEIREEIHTFFH